MGLQPQIFPNPSLSISSTTNNPQHSSFHHGGGSVSVKESNRSLRSLLLLNSNGEEPNLKNSSITLLRYDDNRVFPMAFADELFRNGVIAPLRPPDPKLPQLLQSDGKGNACSKSLRVGFHPFAAAVDRIRKEDAASKPFHWRSLERSVELSCCRIIDDGGGEVSREEQASGRRRTSGCRGGTKKVGREKGRMACRRGRHSWNMLSCFSSAFMRNGNGNRVTVSC